MRPFVRRTSLIAALAVLPVLGVRDQPHAAAAPAGDRLRLSTELSLHQQLPQRPAFRDTQAGLFNPPERPKQRPALAPSAHPAAPPPPPPYRFAGMLLLDGDRVVYLSDGDKVLEARVGATLDGAYRIDSISETAIGLTYLPLRRKSSIAVTSNLRGTP